MEKFFARVVEVRSNEIRALWLGFAFHFLILTGYYITKPIRDSIGASSSLEALPWMFFGTLLAMLVANAAFAATVARMSRRKFIPLAYTFFIVVFVLFFVAMRSRPAAEQEWIGRGFFVWVSVFNLFNTAVFWAFMTDLFTVEQGKRLYGFIAVGGTLGAILGAYITRNYVRDIGPAYLLIVAAAMFGIAAFLMRFFPSGFSGERQDAAGKSEERIGGSIWSGVTHIFLSPYLMGLAATILFYTVTSTWAYFQQSDLVRQVLKSGNERTEFLASLDIWVNVLTVLIQIFLTSRLLKWFGIAFTLVALPFLSMVGFAAMGAAASLALFGVFQVARRAAAYALLRPSREILFTVLKREDKYKVKSLTDTLGYRAGDQLGAWSYFGLHGLGLELQAISWIAVPLTAGWCALSIWLARKQRVLAEEQEQQHAQ